MEESPSSKWHWVTEERLETDPGRLSPGATADTRWSKGWRELLFTAGKRELAEAGGQGHVLGRDQMACDSAVQQCSAVGTASTAGPGGKAAQRKPVGTAAPRQEGRPWLRQPSDQLCSGFRLCWSCGCFCWASSSECAEGLFLGEPWGKINRRQLCDKRMPYFPPC